jgi:hypothetical protein
MQAWGDYLDRLRDGILTNATSESAPMLSA